MLNMKLSHRWVAAPIIPNNLLQYSEGPPNGGVECRWGMKKSRFSTNDTRRRHSYRGTPLIGTRTLSVEWCWCKSPRTQVSTSRHYLTLNRLSQKLYEIQTQLQLNTNRDLRPTQGRLFEWPRMALSDLAKYSLCDSWASCFYLVPFSRYFTSNNGVSFKSRFGLGVAEGLWKWHSIDTTSYWSVVVSACSSSCAIF